MEDPTLAQEMVKLLRDELERIRAQIRQAKLAGRQEHIDSPHSMVTSEELYELQQENIRLKEEVEALQANVETFPRTSEGSEHRGSPNHLSHQATADRLDKQPYQDVRVVSAIEDAIKYETEAAAQEEKVADARQKMQTYKSECTQLEGALSAAKELLKETKSKCVEEKGRLEILQAELETRTLVEFDPTQFLQAAEPTSVDSVAHVLASSEPTFDMPQDLLDLCVGDGFIAKNANEIVWPKGVDRRSRCLSLSTTHRYNPRLKSKGGWELTWDMEEHRGVRDFFYMQQLAWTYIGTYEWVGQVVCPFDKVRAFANSRIHHPLKRAAILPGTLPPAITDIASSMIKSGTLKVLCTGWRRVGFNNALAKALQSRQPSPPMTRSKTKQAGCGAVPIAVPTEGARDDSGVKATKRAGGSIQGQPRKKHRKS
ncbi:hypothetical protein C2E23DRAFT_151846 [Lenzites betulinus]|nr:hypothetical protein C2E23DRAFT_151846 [Lenzites betulinus]